MATSWTQLETGTTTSWMKNRGFPASVVEIADMVAHPGHGLQISDMVVANSPAIASFVSGGGTAWDQIEDTVTTSWTQIEKG